MAKYYVYFKAEVNSYKCIEANSEEDAIDKAEKLLEEWGAGELFDPGDSMRRFLNGLNFEVDYVECEEDE